MMLGKYILSKMSPFAFRSNQRSICLFFPLPRRLAHRDIKPHNILLDFNRPGPGGAPSPVLMDFGSCASCAPREIKTHQEAMLLKVCYVPFPSRGLPLRSIPFKALMRL